MRVLPQALSFQWDDGNINKNRSKHGIENEEAESAFLDGGKVLLKDVIHSAKEERFILLATSQRKRLLFVVLTVRKGEIRIISVRIVNKKERTLYEKRTQTA